MGSLDTQITYCSVNIRIVHRSFDKDTYLIDVQVGAIFVQKRVVIPELRGINAVVRGHFFAGVIWYDGIYILAVCVWRPQAQGLIRHEVRALIIDLRVQNHELIATTGISIDQSPACELCYIQGNALGSANRITIVT